MTDWLSNASRQLNLTEATIDILNATIEPRELNLYPLQIHIKDLKSIINSELIGNRFPTDFIVEAKIKTEFINRTIRCFPYIIDKDGHKYESEEIVEEALEENFDALAPENIYPKKQQLTFPKKIKFYLGIKSGS